MLAELTEVRKQYGNYGAYFLATYFGSKNIIKEEE